MLFIGKIIEIICAGLSDVALLNCCGKKKSAAPSEAALMVLVVMRYF